MPDARPAGSSLRQLLVYGVVAGASAALYFLLYNVLRTWLGPFSANGLAATVCVCLSFWANRRLTFGQQGRDGIAREFAQFVLLFLSTVAASTVALSVVLATLSPSRLVENLAIATASVLLTLVRFWVLRVFVYGRRTSTAAAR